MEIAFEKPYYLLLLPIFLGLVVWMARKLRMADKRQKRTYIILRCIILSLLVLVLTGVSVGKKQDLTTTIFLVDVSDSMQNHVQEVQQYLSQTIAAMPAKNQMGVVAFGLDAKVEQFVTGQKLFTELATAPVKTATNVESALSAALSLFPEDTAKRIVLITDGQENEGSMLNLSATLQMMQVELVVVPMTWEVGEEVYVDQLTIPDTIRVGDQYAITVTVVSSIDTDAVLTLYSGRTMKGTENVYLTAGENQFVFYDSADSDGFRSYRVRVEASHDTMTVNNEYSAYAQIESRAKILLVEGEKDEAAAFTPVLEAAGIAYERVTPRGVPATINQMLEYKSVVLLNVYYDDLREEFAGLLPTYVKDYAGGLITIGGDNSFALGNYRGTPLEEALPVMVDLEGERQIPKMELDMVIDHSGSMDMTEENATVTALDLAKAAARKALETLRKTDQIGVLAFDDAYTWVVKPQLAADTDAIGNAIGTITAEGGTNIYPALDAAARTLTQSDASIKHIILLTDGQDTYSNYDALISYVNEAGITLSTVAVGTDANVELLSYLAESCNGRFYYTDINEGIPKIFAKEVYLSTKEYLVNETFTPQIAASHELVAPFTDGFPVLKGYIASTVKPTATTVLKSPKDDPVLTVWQYGLGKSIAWNSDVTGEWTGEMAVWDRYVEFWKRLLDYSITQTGLGEDALEVVQEGSSARITYTMKDYDVATKVTGVCTDEDGNQTALEFDPVSPGVYQAKVATNAVGVYNIALKNQTGDTVKSVNTATTMQYSPEYRFSETTDSLSKLVALTGGKELTMEDAVFTPLKQHETSRWYLGNLLLVVALLLFMADVVMRRLHLCLGGRRLKKEVPAPNREPKKEEKAVTVSKRRTSKKETEQPKTLDTNTLLQRQRERER